MHEGSHSKTKWARPCLGTTVAILQGRWHQGQEDASQTQTKLRARKWQCGPGNLEGLDAGPCRFQHLRSGAGMAPHKGGSGQGAPGPCAPKDSLSSPWGNFIAKPGRLVASQCRRSRFPPSCEGESGPGPSPWPAGGCLVPVYCLPSVRVSFSSHGIPFYKDTGQIGWGSSRLQCDLIITSYIGNNSISK